MEGNENLSYVVGLRIDDSSDKKLHMTLAATGKLNNEGLNSLKKSAEGLAAEILPLTFKLGEKDMFGKDNDILVRHAKVESYASRYKILEFYGKHANRADPFFNEKKGPNFHVSLKESGEELEEGKKIVSSEMFIKPINTKTVKYDEVWAKKV